MDIKTDLELQIEAILFSLGKSVELRQLSKVLDKADKEIEEAIKSLQEKYERNSAFIIKKYEKSYQLATKDEYFDTLVKVVKTPKKPTLTDAVLETLAIIAYKQPITKAEIEKIRAVSSEYSVNKLIEYGLIYEAGRLDAPGRPVLFATTEEFLRCFDLDSKKNLPLFSKVLEVELEKEVEEELNYKFGFEEKENE